MNEVQHNWQFNWPMLIVAAALVVIYFLISKGVKAKAGYYFAGVFLLLLVTVSPLDLVGHHYLFSAHMVQHIFILLVIPPLLLSGIDGTYVKNLNVPEWIRSAGNVIFHPVVAWVIGIGSMWIWHIPALFVMMKTYPALHFLHTFSLLIAGIIFIWPVYSPVRWRKLSTPLLSVLYLFMACIGCTILGILLTFSQELYYAQSFIYNDFLPESLRMSPSVDQQVAGLIMWVPACTIYIINTMVILGRWLKSPEPDYNK